MSKLGPGITLPQNEFRFKMHIFLRETLGFDLDNRVWFKIGGRVAKMLFGSRNDR